MNKTKYSFMNKYYAKCPDGYYYNPDSKYADRNGCIKYDTNKPFIGNITGYTTLSSSVPKIMKPNEKNIENYNCDYGYTYDPQNNNADKKGCIRDSESNCSISDLNINHNDNNNTYNSKFERYGGGGAFSIAGALKYPQQYNNFYYAGVS
jgi:hypothetical protein